MSKTGMPQRAISVLLACALACTMVPATGVAFAADADSAQQSVPAAEQAQTTGEAGETASDPEPETESAADSAAQTEAPAVPERVNEDVPVAAQQQRDEAAPAADAAQAETAEPEAAENAEAAKDDIDMLTTSVNLSNAGTVLSSNGLAYQVNADDETVAVIGWAGNAPAGTLTIPSQVVVGTKTYKVTAANNVRGGVHR